MAQDYPDKIQLDGDICTISSMFEWDGCVWLEGFLTLVLRLLYRSVLSLVSIEPHLHTEVWLSASLVQLVPWFGPRQAVR